MLWGGCNPPPPRSASAIYCWALQNAWFNCESPELCWMKKCSDSFICPNEIGRIPSKIFIILLWLQNAWFNCESPGLCWMKKCSDSFICPNEIGRIPSKIFIILLWLYCSTVEKLDNLFFFVCTKRSFATETF